MDYASDPSKLSTDDLKTLQRELKADGFYTGKVDGEYGRQTATAWGIALVAHLTGPILTSTVLDDAKRAEFERLWNLASIRPEHRAQVEADAHRILANRDRYAGVEASTRVPWYVIGVIHLRECDCRFDQHLHNGDSLSERTVHVPAGRPATSHPPFPWAYSAADALEYDHFTSWQDWSLAGSLHKLEAYNGFGYRHHAIQTPYLWSFSAVGRTGKYVADGVFDPAAQDEESGCAAILKALVETGAVSLAA